MPGQTISVEIDIELSSKLDAIAQRTHQPTASLVSEAIARYVEHDLWLAQAVQTGLRAAEEGRTADHARVREWVQSWSSGHELPPPKCG